MDGRPYSERSRKGSNRIKRVIKSFIAEIKQILPKPTTKPIYMFFEIFSTDPSNLPDIDRLTHPIMDAFEDIVYYNDKQIRELKPRIFDSTKLLVNLQVQTHPMGLHMIESIPSGSLYPLCKEVKDYFAIRVLY